MLQLLLAKTGLTPLWIFYLTFLLMPVLLSLWSRADRTLRIAATEANPWGHGFLSAINLFLLVVPFPNYAVFTYYDAYAGQIRNLLRLGTLEPPGGRTDLFDVFHSPWALGLTAIGYLIGVALAVTNTLWHQWRKEWNCTTWPVREGRPRPISLVFNFLFFVLQLGIVFNWFLRHIVVWIQLNQAIPKARTFPYHADGMFGLGPLRELAWHSFAVVALLSLLVAVWLMGARITRAREPLFRNPGHMTALLALVFLGPMVVVLPLERTQHLIEGAKRAELGRLSARSMALSEAVQADFSTRGASEQIERRVKELDNAARLRQAILKKAFEGKLVAQDPNDEPASLLLERIRRQRAEGQNTAPARQRRGRKDVS